MVGTSNPHPHCQIYGGSLVYATMAREAEVAEGISTAAPAARCSKTSSSGSDGPSIC